MAHDDGTLSISVNGEHRRIRDGMTIADLALELGLEPTRVAVERNMEVVPRSTLADVRVEDGDDFEIVTFVGLATQLIGHTEHTVRFVNRLFFQAPRLRVAMFASDQSHGMRVCTIGAFFFFLFLTRQLHKSEIGNLEHQWEKDGFGHLPICMAKTQYSFSTDPNLRGAPTHHVVPIREVRLSRAAREMDLAAITTIHGFCQRVLAEHALAAGQHPFVPA